MAVHHAPESAHAKELWKWDHTIAEVNPVDGNIRGLRPLGPQPYPARMYKAGRIQGVPAIVEACEVNSEAEQRNAESLGFVAGGQGAAMDALHRQDVEFARLAANREFTDRKMGEQARAEAERIDSQTSEHLPVIPETPVRKRRTKAQMAADAQ